MNRVFCSWVGHEWRLVGGLENILVKRCKHCSSVRARIFTPVEAQHLRDMATALSAPQSPVKEGE